MLQGVLDYFGQTSFGHFQYSHGIMLAVGLVFIYLAIAKDCEPLLLVPLGFGIMVGNIPYADSLGLDYASPNSVFSIFYDGLRRGWYPPLIFLGIGAITDFSAILANPKLLFLGAAAQVGIFLTLIGAIYLGFDARQAASIGIIGSGDGPTSIFLASKMAPELLSAIAIAGYSYVALIPIIQSPVMRLLTTRRERLIRMKPPRRVSRRERVLFPIIAVIASGSLAPGALPLLGMLFLGNLLRECTVTERLAQTVRTVVLDAVTIVLAFSVGVGSEATRFLTGRSLKIFGLGAAAFIIATAGGVMMAKLINVFVRTENKINPLIGAAGISAVPESARLADEVGHEYDPNNHLLQHAMGPNAAGVIGSAIAAGVLLGLLR